MLCESCSVAAGSSAVEDYNLMSGMSKRSETKTTSTARGLLRYEIEIWHKELNKYQVIRGDNDYVVEQKACAKMAQWDEMWKKQLERERRVQEIAKKKQLADERTAEAQETLAVLERVLTQALAIDSTVNWESLKDHTDYPVPRPEKPALPKPVLPEIPPEPRGYDPKYMVEPGILDRLITSRRTARIKEADEQFERDHQTWQEAKEKAIAQYESQTQEYERKVKEQEAEYKTALVKWEKEREEYLNANEKSNAAIDKKKEEYLTGAPEAVVAYCDIVLSNSEYPDYFPKSYELEYRPDNGLFIVDYQLPSITSIPAVREVKYIQSRDDFDEEHISQAQLSKLYDHLLYQISLRTVHELYEADKISALVSIVFNGYVRSIDPAMGQETNACVLSLQVTKDEFEGINLASVNPKACFKKLKGVGSSKLHSLTPIAPIMRIEREDRRFISAHAVADTLGEEDNIAAMDWGDFEHLVRELFEKEFASTGGEVKVTRASGDWGVDAIAFDPDPIRGGKIVIQAKRYTDTVDVSAVRDLYGTVFNEGANKGILITTSDYGPEAYEFAKGKPLVLLNGGNLLHLLQKHGYRAKIDIQEARRTLGLRQTS
jgi:restriction system protein